MKPFYVIVFDFNSNKFEKYDIMETPIAVHISKRVLTLPLYADLQLEDVDRISEAVLSCRK